MEFCPRCKGGEIEARNCPACGGSGFVSDVAPTPSRSPVTDSVVSNGSRRRQIQSYRESREEEKRRTVRVNSKPGPKVSKCSRPSAGQLTAEERKDRDKWRRKYEARQAKRQAEAPRSRHLSPKQIEAEARRRRERDYVNRLNKMTVCEKGVGKSRRPVRGVSAQ